MALVPLRRSRGDLGLELAPSWNLLNAGPLWLHLGTLDLKGLYRLRLPNRAMAFIFRLGAGLSFFYGTREGEAPSRTLSTWLISAGGGVSFRWYLPAAENLIGEQERTFLETGLEYMHGFSEDTPRLGYLKPFLGVGRRF